MDPITTTIESARIPTAPTEPSPNSQLDKDAFLKLLVAQLKYQDPTAPTDVSQMMQQTSALSMVERLDQIAVGIERLGGGAPLTSAASMLGREVTFDVGSFEPITATVDSVRLVDGDVVLSAGGFEVPLESLIEVAATASFAAPPPATTASTATGTTTTASAPASDDSAAGDTSDGHYDTPDY